MVDPLTAIESEVMLLGSFFVDPDIAGSAAANLEAGDFSIPENRAMFDALSGLWGRGQNINPISVLDELKVRGKLEQAGGPEAISELINVVPVATGAPGWAHQVMKTSRARKMRGYLEKSLQHLESTGLDGGEDLAVRLVDRLTELHSKSVTHASRAEIVDMMIAMTEHRDTYTIQVPIRELNRQIGPLVPALGELVGLSAYSGGGKSTLAANLTIGWCLAGQPVIVFPTEMGRRFIARMGAAYSATSQMRAEKNVWWVGDEVPLGQRDRIEHQRLTYVEALKDIRGWPLEIVEAPNITVTEVISRARVLRKRYDKPPVVIVDHLHRLNYGTSEANKSVGEAARKLKNFGIEEEVVVLALTQPRKPLDHLDFSWKPVTMYEIRGDSSVANEIDVHMSCYRPYVKYDMDGNLLTGPDGMPVEITQQSRWDDADVHHVSTHMRILPDKRRVGGRGEAFWTKFHAESGLIEEVLDV